MVLVGAVGRMAQCRNTFGRVYGLAVGAATMIKLLAGIAGWTVPTTALLWIARNNETDPVAARWLATVEPTWLPPQWAALLKDDA